MNGIPYHAFGIALMLAVMSAVLSGQFGLGAIEALVVCSLGGLTVSVALVSVACILQRSSEPLRMALEVAKRESAAIVAIARSAIGR